MFKVGDLVRVVNEIECGPWLRRVRDQLLFVTAVGSEDSTDYVGVMTVHGETPKDHHNTTPFFAYRFEKVETEDV